MLLLTSSKPLVPSGLDPASDKLLRERIVTSGHRRWGRALLPPKCAFCQKVSAEFQAWAWRLRWHILTENWTPKPWSLSQFLSSPSLSLLFICEEEKGKLLEEAKGHISPLLMRAGRGEEGRGGTRLGGGGTFAVRSYKETSLLYKRFYSFSLKKEIPMYSSPTLFPFSCPKSNCSHGFVVCSFPALTF